MAGLLKGKTVVITGSASGIGRSTALAAASQGANLVLHHLGAPTAHQAEEVRSEVESRGAKAIVVEGDVADLETSELLVNAAVSAFGRVDAVVASAGICQFHPFLTLPRDLYLRTQDVNINGVFYLAQAAARQMVKQELVDGERGCFVGISSISAIMGGGEQCHYTPTKAAIRSLMESCAIAMGQHAIRFNSIMPGVILTPLNEKHLENPTIRNDQQHRIPLGRLGSPDEVADAIIFMCSRWSRFVNGTGLLVDGGMHISLQ